MKTTVIFVFQYGHYTFPLDCNSIWYLVQVEIRPKGKASVTAAVPKKSYLKYKDLSVLTKSYGEITTN